MMQGLHHGTSYIITDFKHGRQVVGTGHTRKLQASEGHNTKFLNFRSLGCGTAGSM